MFSKDKLDVQNADDEEPTFSYYKRAGMGYFALEIILSVISGGVFYVVF